MTDLLYFGYTWDEGSKSLEQEFISEFKEEFPDVRLKNAYDDIKGYRQEVHVPDEKIDDYLCWMIAHEWINCSLYPHLKPMADKEEFDRIVKLAKQKYPECFNEDDI